MKLRELAEKTGAKIEGLGADRDVTGAAGLDVASPTEVSFLSNPRYRSKVGATKALAVYVSEEVALDREMCVLRAKDPYLAYTRALRLFHPESKYLPGIHPTAVIDETASIAPDASIGAYAVIGAHAFIEAGVRIHPHVTIYEKVHIGRDSVIHSGAQIREGARLGQRTVIHNNTVIGADGFGYARDEEKRWLKIPQTGNVVIEDDVEIGACSTIDKASVGETRIGSGTKIDNLVQIGHSCNVEENALLCSQVGLAGSGHIGKRVILTGQTGVSGHLKIGDDVIVSPQSGIANDIETGKVVMGSPAMDLSIYKRASAAFKKLGEYPRIIRSLEKRILELERQLAARE